LKSSHRFYHQTILCTLLGLLLLTSCSNSEQAADTRIDAPEKVVPVELELVTPIDLTETFILPASLEAWEDLVLSAEIAGPVKKINYQEGQQVRAGSVLLEIDPDTLESNLVGDEENVAVIQRKLKRYRQLAAEGLVSEQLLDELENSLTAADVALRTARLRLAKCYPKAPINGIVDRHYVDRGEYVDPGKPLLRLIQIDKLKAVMDVPEKDVAFLKVGQEVEIIPATIDGQTYATVKGTIEQISYTADAATRTYRTKIVIENSARRLRPGMIVRARFVRRQLRQVIAVPLYSVLNRDGGKFVFIEDAGLAKKIKVEIGSSVDQRIVIKSGLRSGQKLIVKGQQLLIDGVKIASGEK